MAEKVISYKSAERPNSIYPLAFHTSSPTKGLLGPSSFFTTDTYRYPQDVLTTLKCLPPKVSELIWAQLTRTLCHHISLSFLTLTLFSQFSCVGVWQNDRVEIIANDQGNRTTPSYVSFSDNERLIGDAAKNQVAMNPNNT